jgi:hypothetical protein
MPTTEWEHEKPTNSPVRRQPLRASLRLLSQTSSYFFLWDNDFDSFSLLEEPFPSLL